MAESPVSTGDVQQWRAHHGQIILPICKPALQYLVPILWARTTQISAARKWYVWEKHWNHFLKKSSLSGYNVR